MAEAKRDQNYVTTLIGVSSADGITPVTVYVDPVTHRLLVNSAAGGTGTVTSVSIVTANGISGSVATATTTPAITLTLGAITPTSVNGLTISATTGTLTITSAKTFSVTNTLTLSGTDGSTLNIGTGGTLGTAAYTASSLYGLVASPLSQFAATTSAQLAGVISDETGTGALVFANSPTLVTPNIGAATGTSLTLGGVAVPTISSTSTFTGKRVQPRVVVVTAGATPTINTDNGDVFQITGLSVAITSMTTNLSGTPAVGEMMMIQITDNGTARAITWGASFASTTVALPTTTVISTMLRVLFQRNNANTVWDCISVV